MFIERDGDAEPYVIPAWSAAIATINRMRLPTEQNPPPQYLTFPPPRISRSKRIAPLLTAWLHIRHHWIGQVAAMTTEKPIALKAQTWRDLLNAGIGGPQPSVPTADNLSKTQRALDEVGLKVSSDGTTLTFANGEILRAEISRVSGAPSRNRVSWRDSLYDLVAEGIPEYLQREILWELYELNFRYDLLALDDILGVPSPDVESLMEHQARFQLCWGGDRQDFYTPSRVSIPIRNMGLSSDKIDSRLRYLRHLYTICKTWPDFAMPAGMDDIMHGIDSDRAVYLEGQLYSALQQTFYDLYARPMVPPRRLFQAA